MNRTVKEATIKAFHYPAPESLKAHVLTFVSAYNSAKHPKAVRWKTPFEAVCNAWTTTPEIFKFNPRHLIPGPNIQQDRLASPMTTYGYARVSTRDQDLGIQRTAFKAAGCKVIRAEKASGPRRDGRTELQVLLDFVQPGDTLVVTRIDRLARSMKPARHRARAEGKDVALRATEQPVDTGTATGKAFLDMLGVFAEFETNLRREQQLEGIKAAKEKGIYKGRKPSIDAAELRRLRDEEKLGPAAIARRLGIGRASVYRVLGKSTPT